MPNSWKTLSESLKRQKDPTPAVPRCGVTPQTFTPPPDVPNPRFQQGKARDPLETQHERQVCAMTKTSCRDPQCPCLGCGTPSLPTSGWKLLSTLERVLPPQLPQRPLPLTERQPLPAGEEPQQLPTGLRRQLPHRQPRLTCRRSDQLPPLQLHRPERSEN